MSDMKHAEIKKEYSNPISWLLAKHKECKAKKLPFYKNPLFYVVIVIAAVISFFMPGAEAYTVPAASDPGYDFYNLVVKKGLQGPIGFAAGVWLLIDAGTTMGSQPKVGALKALGGGALIKAEDIATTLGYNIHAHVEPVLSNLSWMIN